MFRSGRQHCYMLFILLSATLATGHAASFDCGRASTEIEHAICGNPKLSELDGQLGTLYRTRLAQDSSLRSAQLGWIRERNLRCGPDITCLTGIVCERIRQFETPPGAAISASDVTPASSHLSATEPAHPVSPSEQIVEIPQIEPFDLDRIERAEPPPPPRPKDPLEDLVDGYFKAQGGNIQCGEGGRSYHDYSDLAGAYNLDVADLEQPRSRSYQLSKDESARFSAWQSCHMYATQQRWARLIPAISNAACNQAAARVKQAEESNQNGLADVLEDLASSCRAYADQSDAGARFLASVRRLADRTNFIAAEIANRTLTDNGEQRRQIADAKALAARQAEERRVQQEIAEAERKVEAERRAEVNRKRNAELATARAIENKRAAAEKKKECDAVLKDEDTINLIALQILDRTYEGGICAQSMHVCHRLIEAFVVDCSFRPASKVARCLVEQMHGCVAVK